MIDHSPSAQEVAVILTAKAEEWGDLHTWEDQLRMAKSRAASAARASKLVDQRRFAIEAAARLIDAADELARMILIGET